MAKKAAPKAAETKAAPASAVAEKPAAAPSARGPKPATKSEIFAAVAEQTQLSKKEIATVFSALNELIGRELGQQGPGQFIIPGLLKLKTVHKPATEAKPGVNPFTKEPMTIAAKPARNIIKAQPLKALKDLV